MCIQIFNLNMRKITPALQVSFKQQSYCLTVARWQILNKFLFTIKAHTPDHALRFLLRYQSRGQQKFA